MRPHGEDPAPHAGEAFGKARRRGRWSWGHRAFVFVLMLPLCFGIFVLVVIAKVRSHAPLCIPSTPALARLPASQLQGLRDEVASVMARAGGRTDTAGYVPAHDVWWDDPPESVSLKLAHDGRGPASYELRTWAPDPRWGSAYRDHLVGDVFMFASARQARRFFESATATTCYRSSAGRPAPRPPGARNLIWSNPDAATQEDVFLLRGALVYRIAVVRPGADERPSWSAEQQAGVATVNRLACSISRAACPQLSATDRFVEAASQAVCTFNGELVSRYENSGPWTLFPTTARTQAIVARAIQTLRAITPPPAQAAAYRAFTDTLARLLALGREWNAAEVAGDPTLARQYFERAPAWQKEFARLGNVLGVYECAPIEARRASG
jgi:hypothetical protein